jgi:hypothetical protein
MQPLCPVETTQLDYNEGSHLNVAIVSCGNNTIRLQ